MSRRVVSLALPLVLAASMFAVSSLFAAEKSEKEADWQPLFSGTNLDGWKETGHAVFKVEDGMLLGTQTDGRGGDLYTEEEFANFELRFTYKMKWPANSGVWFRDKYQYDILKWEKPRGYSGTLYCPGKMFITANLKEDIENRDDWNEGYIRADGDHLVLTLNGTTVGDTQDKTHKKGRVGIQVHGGDQFKNMEIRFKRIEIRVLD